MTESDVENVAKLYLAAYHTSWPLERARVYLEKFYRFEPESCLVATEGGRIVGAILAYSFERETGFILYIQELMVHPEAQSRGIGKAMVKHLRELPGRGPTLVKIKPLVKADTNVLNFYNSLGFEKDKVVSFSLDIE